MTSVHDASALLAYIGDESGADEVESLLLDPQNLNYVHLVNLAEVFYNVRRDQGEAAAQTVIQDLLAIRIRPRDDLDTQFWQDAARLKADYRRVSLADCFCMALARRIGGQVVTVDHHEFDPLVPLGLCPIRFIR